MTTSLRKSVPWILAALGVAALLIGGLMLLAPTLVNLQSVKREIETVTSREVGGTVTTRDIGLSFLPRPRIVLSEPRISIPGSVEGSMQALDIQIRLFPLLKRRIEIISVELRKPDFTFMIRPASNIAREKVSEKWTERKIAAVFASFTVKTAGLTTSIDSGRFLIREGDREVLSVRDIDLGVQVPSDQQPPGIIGTDEESLPQFMITGRIDRATIESPDLPGPVPVRVESFKATSDQFIFRNLSVKILDGSATATGSLPRYLKGVRKIELHADARLGARIEEWIRTRAGLPLKSALRTPIDAKNVRLLINRGKESSVAADVSFSGGTLVSFKASFGPEQVWIRKCTISDAESQASIAVRISGQEIDASFEGMLTHASLGRLLNEEQPSTRWIRGSIRGQASLSPLFLKSLDGDLEAENLVIPVKEGMPVEVRKLKFKGQGNAVHIGSASLVWSEISAEATGTVVMQPEYVELDLDVVTGDLNVQRIREVIAGPRNASEQPAPAEPRPFVPFPVQGVVRVAADSVEFGNYQFRPVRAVATIEQESVSLDHAKTSLCGINLNGGIRFRKNQIALDVRVGAENKPVDEALTCFRSADHRITGTFSLSSHLTGSGKPDEVLKLLSGPIAMKAVNGNISRMFTVARILDILNKTEVFRGKYPDLGKEGLRYNSISVQGGIDRGILTVREGMMDGTTMEMAAEGTANLIKGNLDFRVAVAPLKTVDAVVKKLPVLMDILRGTLIVVPFRVTGTLDKPNVKSISLSDAGEGVSGIFSRTLKAPFKIVEGIVPGSKTKKE